MKTLQYSIIAILGIIFIFSNNVAFADNIKSTDSFLQKCNNDILPIPTLKPASVNSSSPKLGILVMQPNSVATVCIKYVKLSHGNSSFETNNTQLIPSVGIENIQVQGRQISFGSMPVNNVVAKASQKIISFGSQENASTVILYTLSAKPDSVGYYHVGIPYMCGNILLAVGFPGSQIDASAFQDVSPMCFNYGVETPIVGIQGASMTYVDISNKTIYSTKLPENISIIPPLQQMRINDDARFIQCNPDLQLVFKSENGSPACVKPESANKLIAIGWAVAIYSHYSGVRPFDTLKMNVIGTDLSFNYAISGGQLENAIANMQNQSLDLSLNTKENGTLTVILPRGLIDSQIHSQDTPFIIMEDGREMKYKQIDSTLTDITLVIPFQYGVTKIEIIAPEPIR